MRLLAKILISILSLVGVLAIGVAVVNYFDPKHWGGYLLNKKEVYEGIFKFGFFMHITTAPFLLAISTLLVFWLRPSRNRKLHRLLGKIYVALVLFISGPGGLILSFFAIGGWFGTVPFLFLSTLWMVFTWKAFALIKAGKVGPHKRYMERSFILCFSAIILRLLLMSFSKGADWNGPTMYVTAAWMSWTIPLGAYEVSKWYSGKQGQRSA